MGRRKLPINYIKTTGHTKPTPFQKVEATDATYKGNSWKPILATCRRWVSIFLSNATSSDFTYNLHRLGLIALFTTAKQKKLDISSWAHLQNTKFLQPTWMVCHHMLATVWAEN
jgi:hypothetical protein